MSGLLRFVLIIALIYYGFRFLLRLFMPWILMHVSKSMAKRYGFNTEQFNKKPPATEKQKPKPPKVGEYVDYEEIED